jgi:hypothetical protein
LDNQANLMGRDRCVGSESCECDQPPIIAASRAAKKEFREKDQQKRKVQQ